jgi:hypothetical protein
VELVDALCGFAEPSIDCQVKMRKERGTKKRRVYNWHQSTEKQSASFSIHDILLMCAWFFDESTPLGAKNTETSSVEKKMGRQQLTRLNPSANEPSPHHTSSME